MKVFLTCSCLVSGLVSGQTVLFSDNFDTPDTANFDAAPIGGRHSGTLADVIELRSWGAQQDIRGNQAFLPVGGNSGLRFENSSGPMGGTNRFNWASGASGAAILGAGGFTVTFDWTPAGNTSPNWISFQVGTINGDSGNLTDDDYGILFRQNGATERFDNTVNLGAGGSFPATSGVPRKVEIVYAFQSFADGESVNVISSVDGIEVANDVFTWDGNLGEMRMELGSNDAGQLIDNLTVTANDSAVFNVSLDNTSFSSALVSGSTIGSLSALFSGAPVGATFALIPGEGDTDNDKFQLNGANLEIGDWDFKGEGSTNGQEFSIRVGASSNSGPEMTEVNFVLTIFKDDDDDDLLDDWELRWSDQLDELSGLSGDFDNDGLSDLEEYRLSLGLREGFQAYPDIDPTQSDTDGDTLEDREELVPTGVRPPTNPTLADTDQDGLSDLVENNTGFFTSATELGTNPTLIDTDQDGARDLWEIERSTDPLDIASFPPSDSPSVTVTQITDLQSSGISDAKIYTHTIAGGQAVTVNGVSFEALTATETPPNFQWDTGIYLKSFLVTRMGDWVPSGPLAAESSLVDLLDDFTYSGNGTTGGASQRYTLTGLTPGLSYDVRLYVRSWDTEGAGRPLNLKFTNGDRMTIPYGALPEDRPGIVLGTGNVHDAYYLSFRYTAQTTELEIEASIHPGALGVTGSFHLYALTNEVATSAVPEITQAGFTTSGEYVIEFSGRPSTTFEVTKSLDLFSGFFPLDQPLQVTTDATGAGLAEIPSSQATDRRAFFRLEPAP